MHRNHSRRRVKRVTVRNKPIGPFTVRPQLSIQQLKRKILAKHPHPPQTRTTRSRAIIRTSTSLQRLRPPRNISHSRPQPLLPPRQHVISPPQPSIQRVINIRPPQQTRQYVDRRISANHVPTSVPVFECTPTPIPTQPLKQHTILPPPILLATLDVSNRSSVPSPLTPQLPVRHLSLQIPTPTNAISPRKIPPPVPRNTKQPELGEILTKQMSISTNQPNIPEYLGYDIHAYTQQINALVKSMPSDLFNVTVSDAEFLKTLDEMKQRYGDKPAFANFKNVFQHNAIIDPQISNINIALVLVRLWNKVNELNEPSTYKHFSETLDQIGHTCIQGVSHRLLMDYNVFVLV